MKVRDEGILNLLYDLLLTLDLDLATVDPETEEENGIGDCNEFTDAFCTAFAAADDCCPECAQATAAYAKCALRKQVSMFCPDASCDTTLVASKSGFANDEGKSGSNASCPSLPGGSSTCGQ